MGLDAVVVVRAGLAQRARIVLLAADGVGTQRSCIGSGCRKPTVIGWKRRYAAEGVAGLEDLPKPGRPRQIDEVAWCWPHGAAAGASWG